MESGQGISYEAMVHPELRALLAGRAIEATEPEPAPPAPIPRDEVTEAVVSRAFEAPWPKILLRRDGRRPLAFRGLPLLRAETEVCDPTEPTRVIWRSLRLFLAQDQRIVCQLVVLPSENVPARPMHRAEYVDDPEALARFLRENDPSECALVGLGHPAAGGLDGFWARLRLSLPLSPVHCIGTAA